jgi:hypothetical protein
MVLFTGPAFSGQGNSDPKGGGSPEKRAKSWDGENKYYPGRFRYDDPCLYFPEYCFNPRRNFSEYDQDFESGFGHH